MKAQPPLVSADTYRRLTDRLNLRLPRERFHAEWDIECADASRAPEFLEAYETGTFSADEKQALMVLLFASFDDLLESGHVDPIALDRLRSCVCADRALHHATLVFWAELHEPDPQKRSPLSSFVKKILVPTPSSPPTVGP